MAIKGVQFENTTTEIKLVPAVFSNYHIYSVIKDIPITSSLSLREAEVLADQLSAFALQEPLHFRFLLDKGFLPTIGWLERFQGLLEPLIKQKKQIEIVFLSKQEKSLRDAGFHLIADLVVAGTQNARSASPE